MKSPDIVKVERSGQFPT